MIHSTAAELFNWLSRLPEIYLEWHPDHIACWAISGSLPEVGSVIECQEYLHGKLHSMRLRLTRLIPNRRIEYTIRGLGRGAFAAEEAEGRIAFIAELEIGSEVPLIGLLFDIIFSRVFPGRIAAMRQHMAEEGQNLKAILESGQAGLGEIKAAARP